MLNAIKDNAGNEYTHASKKIVSICHDIDSFIDSYYKNLYFINLETLANTEVE